MIRLLLMGLFAAAVGLLGAGCGNGGSENQAAAGPRRTLTDLRDITQLRRAFNRASGEPRLIVIISPT
jgi:hypothetical protein